MKEKLQVFALDICKLGDDKIFETLHILAYNSAHASHLGFHMIMDDDSDRYSFPVEIVNVRKELGIKEIINANDYSDEEDEMMEYDPDQPYNVAEHENYPQERVIKFKCCNCKNEQKVANYPWPFLICRDCKTQILHKNLENVGGIWVCHSEK